MHQSKKSRIYLVLLVPLLYYIFFVIVPIFIGAGYSLFSWKGGASIKYVGLRNYALILKDKAFIQALKNNLWVIIVCLFGHCFLGYLYAVILSSKFVRARKLYRFSIFLPVVLSGVVVGYLWKMIYNESPGLLNSFLAKAGLGSLQQLWLGDSKIAMTSICMIMVWQAVGLHMVIYMASLQNISSDVLEAADIDGANTLQKFWYITTPLMKSTIRVSIVLMVTGTLKMFEYVYVTTRGASSTNVLTYYAYTMGFSKLQLGYACAVAIMTILIALILVALVNLVMRIGGSNNE